MKEEKQHGCLQGLPLHKHKEWLEPCANVLNEEWPRSKTARLHMLEKSNDKLPFCIVLLEQVESNQWELIGHSRLCVVHGQPNGCFVESVVIKKSKRGQGFGRKLMEITEQYALKLGYSTIYLTTHDKQHFYEHIGYNYCEPVISLGSASNFLSSAMLERLLGKSSDANSVHAESSVQARGSNLDSCRSDELLQQLNTGTKFKPSATVTEESTVTQKCHPAEVPCSSTARESPHLTSAPPPPPPPPIKLPNPQSPGLAPVRIDPSQVHWMKKVLI